MHFLRCLSVVRVVAALRLGFLRSSPPAEPLPDLLIGYTEFRTDLPGGRYVSEATFRAAHRGTECGQKLRGFSGDLGPRGLTPRRSPNRVTGSKREFF
jgi:hypothetical protein